MTRLQNFLAASAAAVFIGTIATTGQAETRIPDDQPIRNIVLVHGAFADASGWRGVYDDLTGRGYSVTMVQNPLTSLADDVAATNRALERQDGPAILVGHSWGGTVITEAGVHPKVAGLVYVSALSPDAGRPPRSSTTASPRRPSSCSTSVKTATASSRPTASRPASPMT